MKRLVLILAAAVVTVSACGGSSDEPAAEEPSASATSSDPTALSQDGDVEVWDLAGEPSDAGFGISGNPPSADYSGDERRPVRFELDGGSFQLDLADLTFYHPEDDVYAFLSRSGEVEPDELTATYREVLEQLQVDTATADAFESELADAPTDEAGQVSASYPEEIRFGDWTVAVSAAISPSVGTGIVTVSAGHKPLPTG